MSLLLIVFGTVINRCCLTENEDKTNFGELKMKTNNEKIIVGNIEFKVLYESLVPKISDEQ